MNPKTILSLSVVGTFILSGCITMPVESNVTSFHTISSPEGLRGTISIVPADSISDGLEFRSYASHALGWLNAKGLQAAPTPKKADYVGVLSYGIDSGRQELVSTPIYGGGGGSSYSVGAVGTQLVSANTYSAGGSSFTTGRIGNQPFTAIGSSSSSSGIVGSQTDSVTMFTRKVELSIKDRKTGRVVWIGRNQSEGTTGEIAKVLPNMLKAMLKDFPNESGKTKFVRLYD